MEDPGSFILSNGSFFADSLKELPIFAVLHEDVYFWTCSHYFVELSNILVHYLSLSAYLRLEQLQLARTPILDW